MMKFCLQYALTRRDQKKEGALSEGTVFDIQKDWERGLVQACGHGHVNVAHFFNHVRELSRRKGEFMEPHASEGAAQKEASDTNGNEKEKGGAVRGDGEQEGGWPQRLSGGAFVKKT